MVFPVLADLLLEARRGETDLGQRASNFVLMHAVVPKPLRSFGRHALIAEHG